MWKALRKRRALRIYRTKLASRLRARYGVERHYSPQQVERVVRDHGYSVDYLCFALAMYCDRVAFDAYHRAAGESCDYGAMREQVATHIGDGDATFDASTWTTSEDATSSDAGSGGGWDAGGFDGGGGDGGSCSSD